jgi:hypothetical protein
MVIKVGVGAMLNGGFPEPQAIKLTLENFLAGNGRLTPLQHEAEALQSFFAELMQHSVTEATAKNAAALHEVVQGEGWKAAHDAALQVLDSVKAKTATLDALRSFTADELTSFTVLKQGIGNGEEVAKTLKTINSLTEKHAEWLEPLQVYLKDFAKPYQAMRNITPDLLKGESAIITPTVYLESHKSEVESLVKDLLDAVCKDPNCQDPNCVVDAANHMGFLKGVNRPIIIGGLAVAAAAVAAGAYYVHQVGKKAHAEEAVQPREPQR